MSVSDILTDSDRQAAGVWLPLRDAAARLGLSERTLHRRIRTGKLKKRATLSGRLEVWVPGPTDAPASVGRPSVADGLSDADGRAERQLAAIERFNAAVSQQVGPLVDLVERQQRTIAEQAEELGRLRAELARLTVADRMADSDGRAEFANRLADPHPWWAFWRAW